jgi:hypothetical protein
MEIKYTRERNRTDPNRTRTAFWKNLAEPNWLEKTESNRTELEVPKSGSIFSLVARDGRKFVKCLQPGPSSSTKEMLP